MKRVSSMFVIVALLLSTMMTIPVAAATPVGNQGNDGEISTWYVDQDFTGATIDSSNIKVIHATNTITGTDMPWTTISSKTTAADLYRVETENEGTADQNTYIINGYKKQSKVESVLSQPVTPESGKLLYVDMRVKRVTDSNGNLTDDPVTLALQDSSSTPKNIFSIEYAANKYPKLISSVSYGGELASSGLSVLSYPYTADWIYLRSIIDFDNHTFKLYQGDSLNNLTQIVSNVASFTFANAAAADFGKIYAGYKGSLGFDDIKVYSVIPAEKPLASDVTVAGKPNIGATLRATYGTYTHPSNVTEGASYGYWESDDTDAFLNPVKLTEDISITAGGTSDYVLTEAEKGKYLRFSVIPVTTNGIAGDITYSNVTQYPVDSIIYNLKTTGTVKYTTVFDNKYGENLYPGVAEITNTSSQAVNGVLIAAWYQDDVLTEIYTTPVSLGAGSLDETGIATGTFTTTAKDIPGGTSPVGLKLKIFMWDGLDTLTPLTTSAMYRSVN